MSRREKCFVPNCPNSGSKTKDKTFFFINQNLKRKWCKQLNIDYNSKRRFVCCEDHLDLNKDLENYYQWKFMKAKPRLKSTATLKNLSLDNTSSCEKPTENQSGDVETGMKNSPMQTAQLDNPLGNDFEYDCNYCQKSIIGFRYVCVQCEDYDLCEACEAQRVHDTHYVLRIPDQRPQAEINEVLSRVREAVTPVLIRPGLPVNVPEPEVIAEIKEEIEDPLEEDPNSRPHKTNILEESILKIPPNTDDEVDSDIVTSKPSWTIESSYTVNWDNDTSQIISDSDPETSKSEVPAKRPRKVTAKSSAVQATKPEDDHGYTATDAGTQEKQNTKQYTKRSSKEKKETPVV
ncbi:zinc finger, ZZ type domain-containing protein [Phthorimaea operculella]|nr:zinc finger, ZZ type domain-containing protein [Phthorimaea operculella]